MLFIKIVIPALYQPHIAASKYDCFVKEIFSFPTQRDSGKTHDSRTKTIAVVRTARLIPRFAAISERES